MKSIQRVNLDDYVKRMIEAKNMSNEQEFAEAKEKLIGTLKIIKNIDHATYEEYIHHSNDEY